MQAADKKIVTSLLFSHAVDQREREPRLVLSVYDKVTDHIEKKVEPAPARSGRPPSHPGRYDLSVVDDHGASDARKLEIELLP